MNKSYTKLFGLFIILFIFCSTVSANDECINAAIITDVQNWCSSSGAFTLGGATDSGDGSCEIGNRDRWYSFTAAFTDVTIAIIGSVGGGGPTGGTLNDPEITMYSGTCGALTEIKCDADLAGDNTVESYKGGLTPGQTYYFKVDSRTLIGTSFMICLNNYNAPQAPDSDCPTATVLCDKTGFSVPEVTGSGSNNQEMQDAFCFHFPSPFPTQTLETNSVWYTWTALTTGTVSFDLVPANPADDLDFVVYRMPGGFNPGGGLNCNGKVVERCMASGNLPAWTTCFGPTGLDLVSQQHWEYLNCYNDAPTSPTIPATLIDDNYAKALDQVIGNVYALVVNNFTSTGNGFSIEWGGTGLFEGPIPDFTVSPQNLCTNGQIIVTDASFYPQGQLIEWEWDFGVDAVPQGSITQGPHTITYTSGGPKIITLIVTSERYCKVTHQDTVNVIEVSGLIIPINATCTMGGVATVVGTGGILPYTYQWSNGQTGATATGLAPGTYQVIVTDATGCSGTESVTITGTGTVQVLANVISHVTCNGGNNGSASVLMQGGSPPYTIVWSNGGATPLITNLTAGTYSVTVTDDIGCNAVASVTILQPTPILPVILSSSPATCGACNGAADLNVTGGTPPYTYQWSDGSTSQDVTALCSGINTVTVTDASGCTATTSVNIGNNASFGIDNVNSIPVTCPGNCDGSAIVTATGGSMPYTYTWSNGNTTNTIANVCAGNYMVTVTDNDGCSAVATVTVGTAADILVAATPNAGTSCPGLSDGSATITVSGGTPGYLYQWDNGVFNSTNTTLSGGTHTFTVTDSNGCSATGSVVISEAPALNATATGTDINCFQGNDGTATTTATGGTPPYTYSWNPGGGTTPTITGLGAGTYTVTITDDNGCSTVATTTITEPIDISTSIQTVNTLCTACLGAADVTVAGGTPPYTFDWSTGANTEDVTNLCAGSYTLTVTDDNGCTETLGVSINSNNTFGISAIGIDNNVTCNGVCDGSATVAATGGTPPYIYQWGDGQTTPTATGLCAGPLPVTVTDVTGCKEVTGVVITQPPVVTVVTNPTGNVSCNGLNDGSATATGGGGVPPYTYVWSNGTTGTTVTNLGAGTHMVTATDDSGCTAIANVVITEPPLLTLTASPNNGVTCNGDSDGSATATANGGTAPYSYDWGGGNTSPTNGTLTGGNHTVSVTDSNGCTATATVNISEPPPVTVSVVLDNPASCSGQSDGGATATGGGGTAPYSYIWSNGILVGQNTTLPAGTHQVTVTDSNGCSVVGSINVTDPSSLTSSAVQNNPVTCNGGADGSATVTASGGTAPYSYVWNTGAVTTTITTGAGNYSVVVTDANGCTSTSQVTISEPPPLTASASGGSVLCNGDQTGSLGVTPGGGVAPYTYQWDNGAGTGQNPANQGAGTYTVVVTDANGCTITASSVITEPTALTATTTPVNGVTCNGDSDGSATVNPGGGTAPYTFEWDNTETTQTAGTLTGGTHSVTVTDDNGCTIVTSVVITEPPVVTVVVALDNNASCNGASDGGATATGGGGTPPYTYNWSNGINTASNSTLPAGNHFVTVTDNNGCTIVGSINVTDPTAVTASAVQNNPVSCNGGTDGQITATAGGGTPPYTYSWNNGAITATINAGAGSYIVQVTDDNGCMATAQATIIEPPILTASAQNGSVLCNGDQTATITLTPGGGVPPYTYQWDNGAGTGQNPANQGAGTYTVIVTDANGCTTTASSVITEPTALTATTSPVNGVTCNGDSDGSATVNPAGGTTPYIYQWDNNESTQTANVLTGGTHFVTVTDGNGCTIVTSVLINEPPVVTVVVALDNNASCNGASDGGATATGGGGTPPYTYNWSNGINTASNSTLPAGNHFVTVTDNNGCTIVGSINVTDPTAVTATAVQVNPVSCNGGTDGQITATAGGGTSPYTYSWNNGATTATINDGAGTYTVQVTDNNGCMATAQATIVEPPVLTASAQNGSVLCNGDQTGTITLTPGGGVTPYTYQWDNGAGTGQNPINIGAGTYTVLVTDANGCTITTSAVISEPTAITASAVLVSNVSCNGGNDGSATATGNGGTPPYSYNWDNNEITATAINLDQGTHAVTVTDDNGCAIVTTVSITEPPILVSSAQGDALDCNGDSDGVLTLGVSGGTAPYFYAWTNGAPPVQNPANLPVGTYNVVVTDSNGCTTTASAVITEPTILTSVSSASITSCNGSCDGGTSITPTGGTPPYTYLWSDGQVTSNAINLCAGSYSVSVSDANGCTIVESITVGQPTVVTSVMAGINDVDCNGNSNGSAMVTPNGGTAPYTYLWDNGETTPTATGLPAGPHTVSITDSNGCTAVDNITITEPPVLSVSTNGTNITCFAAANGTAGATANGGTGPYTYNWSNNATGPTVGPLTPGGYTVTVTDSNGCTAIASITLTEPTALSNSLTASPASCNGFADGSSTATTLGGTPPYTYQWDNGETTVVATALDAGIHYVTITDGNGCTIVSQTVINEPTLLAFTDAATPPLCYNGADGSATVSPVGGTPPYTITWSNGQTGPTANGLPEGPITVDIVDANGCAINGIQVVVPNHPTELLASTVPTDVLCWNEATGAVAVGVSGGTPGYSYNWSNSETTQDINNIQAGTYTVTVTDDNGCTVVVADLVDQPDNVNLSLIPGGAICFGEQNGTVTVDTTSVTGGVGPFLYSINGTDYQMSPVFTGLGANTYTIYVSDANGCVDSFSSNVGEPNELTVDAGPDITVNLGESAEITPTVTPPNVPVTYSWNPGIYLDCTNCLNPWVTPNETTLYEITVVDTIAGCTAVDDILVTVIKDRNVFIPNAFTPNGDGINDGITVFGDPSVVNIKTFICADRWGEIVFEKANFEPNDPNLGWNGFFRDQLMNSAVFVYYAEVEFVDGTIANFKGDFTLIR